MRGSGMTTRINGIAMDGSEAVGRSLPATLLAIGAVFLLGAGAITWFEVAFIRASVAVPGQVVDMRVTSGGSSPIFTFTTRDGVAMRVVSRVVSTPPCCDVGEAVTVRYRPATPRDASIVSLQDSWLWVGVLGGFGLLWFIPGLIALRAHLIHRRRPAEAVAAATPHRRRPGKGATAVALPAGVVVAQHAPASPPIPLPLAGLRRAETPAGPRWFVQARWTDDAGRERIFESIPLPFDPVPQMRRMSSVNVIFDPGDPNGAHAMDLSFLAAPAPHDAGFRA